MIRIYSFLENLRLNIRIYSDISNLRIKYSNIFVWSKLNIRIKILDIWRTMFEYPNIFEYSSHTVEYAVVIFKFNRNKKNPFAQFSETMGQCVYARDNISIVNERILSIFKIKTVIKYEFVYCL